jgi:hypothetical protein
MKWYLVKHITYCFVLPCVQTRISVHSTANLVTEVRPSNVYPRLYMALGAPSYSFFLLLFLYILSVPVGIPGIILLFHTASRSVLRPTQSLIQWVPGALSLGLKRPEREADHSYPSSA